ncbi:lysophospholipid acyltransferase family protein [Meiothermus taiwanensis]|jgi:1-acyl-sn-glycerol-3-phosphate acyltransferase|uniref:1-acyl-sn-glycerol-3-phosphate acyltransferase n=2 Tax=Meiothermus taiwanensis TaxID=172827 RepID=A0A399E7Y0_9DEIN|nr:lysophospholipid acyltransferase family protein [Meiothermus taiwanensis]AWR85391.1 1-acyl-sn-glycerol-3-phosphate acyltransferase [Meiothermus taiwanensis WR-220]KIQ55278.1 acyl-phosphate glycerol 3-phosphate acyltransferase [Meiothermus taiwanensis]KZK16521.1 acyl-phosphate glycerol 3-phosphate acyltransferase [Meiothermus taiwanensis]RIH78122.1 1-acyl-sn-glycerol-3-phosphate acyltransferase [Meiothermus taiwanensis]
MYEYGLGVYKVCKVIARFLLQVLFGLKVEGAEKIPKEGPVILASNHMSFLDPVVMGVACPRVVSYMSRDDVFNYPILRWLLPRLYVIPVSRGSGDLGAIKAAIRVLKNGMAFGIFPEGRRSRTGFIEPFKTGAAAIALRTGAVIVPAAIIGSDKAWPVGRWPRLRRRIRVVFGDPIVLPPGKPDHQTLEEVTHRLEAAVTALLPPQYHRKPTV